MRFADDNYVTFLYFDYVRTQNAMVKAGLPRKGDDFNLPTTPTEVLIEGNVLTIGDISAVRREPQNSHRVPNPLFYDNNSHTLMLKDLLRTFTADHSNAALIIGNQGVGKNKLVDRLLHLLDSEREYIQLHRDTTIQSLTVLPSLQNGRIVYEDSPLLRAARGLQFLSI